MVWRRKVLLAAAGNLTTISGCPDRDRVTVPNTLSHSPSLDSKE
jgi:hypothetical protein